SVKSFGPVPIEREVADEPPYPLPVGMVKSNTAADSVPEFVTEASVPGSPVVVDPTDTVAAAPGAPSVPFVPLVPSWPLAASNTQNSFGGESPKDGSWLVFAAMQI